MVPVKLDHETGRKVLETVCWAGPDSRTQGLKEVFSECRRESMLRKKLGDGEFFREFFFHLPGELLESQDLL